MKGTDWLLLAVCATLLVSGPAMALQEFSRYQESSGLEGLTGEAPPLEPAFRAAWRGLLLAAVVVGGILGTIVALRVTMQPKVRAVSGRLVFLLLSGMTLLDLAFLADGRWFVEASYAARGATVVWLYPIAGILIGGSVVRLSEVEEAFAAPRAPA